MKTKSPLTHFSENNFPLNKEYQHCQTIQQTSKTYISWHLLEVKLGFHSSNTNF